MRLIIFVIILVTGEGIMELRQAACDKLLLDRVDAKLRGKKISSLANRLRVATPVKRDEEVDFCYYLCLAFHDRPYTKCGE